MSCSSSEVPTSWPWALRKVKHIPPPMSSRSTVGSSASITASLSDTLDPPSTTTYGRSGSPAQPRQHLDLAQHQPARDVRQPGRHVVDAGVLAVHGAERVVHVRVAERGELVGEGTPLGVVLAGLARR